MGLHARSTEQKQARREVILAAALELFATREYDEVQMADIGRAAGVAKGTLYLYFPTKETIFLEVLGGRLDTLLGEASRRLGERRRWSCDDAADLLSGLTCADPTLDRLLVLLHGVLEHNVEVQRAVDFKVRLLAGSSACAAALARAVPSLQVQEAARFLLWFYAAVVGLGGMARPARAAELAMSRRPELLAFKVDLARELQLVGRALLRAAKDAKRA